MSFLDGTSPTDAAMFWSDEGEAMKILENRKKHLVNLLIVSGLNSSECAELEAINRLQGGGNG